MIESCLFCGENGNAVPVLQGSGASYVLPDLDASKDGRRLWVEVKSKSAATLHRDTGRPTHGIARRHFQDYQSVQRLTGNPVWLCVCEEDTGEALLEQLDYLAEHAREYYGDKLSRGGMVFFPRDRFRRRLG